MEKGTSYPRGGVEACDLAVADDRTGRLRGFALGDYTGGAGLRVKKEASGSTIIYIFSGTKVMAEYAAGAAPSAPSREYIYAGSQLLATIEGGTTKYHHSDHLSTRVFTDAAGGKIGERGHYPFGEVWYETGQTNKWKFTSYERDNESTLDYAMFRYDSTRLGRFMTPDPIAGSILDPQTLNRYPYTRNDPINLIDPLGLYGDDGCCAYIEVSSYPWSDTFQIRAVVMYGGYDYPGQEMLLVHVPCPRLPLVLRDMEDIIGLPAEPAVPPGPPILQLPPCEELFGNAEVTSAFGNTNPPYSQDDPHAGVDFQMRGPRGPVDLFVPALHGGTVVEARPMSGLGWAVVVRDQNNFYDLYGHLSEILVVAGQRITTGTILGQSGGQPGINPNERTTGPHLHYQRIAPGPLFDEKGIINKRNSVQPCI